MQLLRLEVKNWCQHKYRVCTFTRGLVAIIGKIGSGKSNLLGAICWLLTGENPNNGLKMENVSQLAVADEPSYASLEFEHAGHTVVVTRHLLPEKEQATLTVDGVEAARGDKAVTAHIERLLGIDSKFMSRFVIVAQNEIFAFIEDGASEVDKFFQKLFGTVNAERCQDTINKQLNKLVIPEVPEPSTLLLAQEITLAEKIDSLNLAIDQLPTLELFLHAQAEQQTILQNWQERVKLTTTLAATEHSIATHVKQLETVAEACAQYTGDLEALQAVLDGSQESSTNAKIALGHLATYRQIAKARESAANRLAEIASIRQRTPEPAAIADDDFKKLANNVAVINSKIQTTHNFVTMFGASGIAECPTCHTPTSNLATAVITAQQELTELEQQLEQAKKLSVEATVQRAARVSWEKQEAEFDAEIKQLTESNTAFAQMVVPDASEEELVKAVADYEKLKKAKAEIEPLAQKEKENKARLDGQLAGLEVQKESLIAQIAKLTVTQIDANLAQNTLNALSQQCVERQNLEKERSQLEFERANLQTRIAAVQADEQKADKLRDWAAVAVATRDALKAAPRLVAKRNLQRLELAINELLQVFGVDFLVRAATDESPTFVAEFFDGRKQPAKRLSYGQKTVLALAFRVAVNALFADQIGLLALDEPTAYLDQQRIRALAPVLERLRELSTARGLQCLMVTHETSLSHLFESAVELDT